MRTIIDKIKWVISLFILYFLIDFSLLAVSFLFDFAAFRLDLLHPFFCIVAWIPIGSLIVLVPGILLIIIFGMSVFVKNTVLFLRASSLLFSVILAFVAISFWSGILNYRWEDLTHVKINRVLYSLILFWLIYIPINLWGASNKVKLNQSMYRNFKN